MIIRPILTNVLSRDITSTKSGIPRNTLNSEKPGETQLIRLQMLAKYDLERFEDFSQNVQKNNFIISSILKINHNFDIILIQELSWTTINVVATTYHNNK